MRFIGALIVLLVAAELGARLLGLADAPVLIADPEIEYLHKPSTSYTRLGKRISFNSHSMRSPEGDEFNVLVFGDSVVNGGSRIDQEDLATAILERKLGKPVGNVSAGSWGPQNMLAYAKRYGFFGARVVVIVLSTHDYLDAPTFAPVEAPPLFALEALLPKRAPPSRPASTEGPLREFLRLAKAQGRVIVAQHLERGEAEPSKDIAAIAASEGAEVLPIRIPTSAYRDFIHPNEAGQAAIAEEIYRRITRASPAS